ncbi:MAG: sigma-70 family RNA polymerase sigma factor [Chloroflexota bacterium]
MTNTDNQPIADLINQVRLGEQGAYETVVHRFQDMAVGYAYAKLGDLFLAEDVAQEAFVQAYFDLPELRDPAAFPGWFRRIVFTQVSRLIRNKQLETIPFDTTRDIAENGQTPVEITERVEMKQTVSAAIATLPDHQREVVTLFYISQYSQKEISQFLDVPVATIKTRLHAARHHLKTKMVTLIQDNLPRQRPSRNDTFIKEMTTMNLALAIVQSCGAAGAQVKLVETDEELETRYSLKVQDTIHIRPHQTVVIDRRPSPPELVFRFYYSQVKEISEDEIIVEGMRDERDRGMGNLVKAQLAPGLKIEDLRVGDDVYGRWEIYGVIGNKKPVDAKHLLATVTPRVQKNEENDTFQLPPNSVAAHTNRGNVYLDHGDYDKAIKAYNQAIALNSKYVVAYTNRGHAYKAMGKPEKAKADFETTVHLLEKPTLEILPVNHPVWRDQHTEEFIERYVKIGLRRAKKYMAALEI